MTVRERLGAMTDALEREDFAAALKGTDQWLAGHPDVGTLGLIYNCRTWIRWGAGDRRGAFDENEQLVPTVAGAEPEVRRDWLLHYWWDRGYLLAEAGKIKEAEAARVEFDRLGDRPDDQDSRKVLEAWVRLLAGDRKGARAAAAAVDVERDADLQDWYVVERALEAGGDTAGAAALREKIRSGPRYPMKPLILQQIKRDGH
jgi:hypothetical protein